LFRIRILGFLDPVGRIYQQTFVDTYSKVAFAKLYDRKTPLTAADLLNDRVIPFFDEQSVKLQRVLTAILNLAWDRFSVARPAMTPARQLRSLFGCAGHRKPIPCQIENCWTFGALIALHIADMEEVNKPLRTSKAYSASSVEEGSGQSFSGPEALYIGPLP
jgi:hypothetical protein